MFFTKETYIIPDSKTVLIYAIYYKEVYFDNVLISFNPKATEGPIHIAKTRVPMPNVPPKNQPSRTTIISIQILTKASGVFVFFCNPVIIHPSAQLLN